MTSETVNAIIDATTDGYLDDQFATVVDVLRRLSAIATEHGPLVAEDLANAARAVAMSNDDS